MIASRRYSALLLLLALTVFASGCTVSRSPVSGRKRVYGYSWAQERQIGAESDPQIIAEFGLYDDPDLASYVTRVGQSVLAESHLRRPDAEPEYQNTPFTFRVLDSPVVNAFALPGGYVYVTRGLLGHLNDEAQLAVVLGHEVGHVAARHASQRAATQQFAQIGLIGGAIGSQVLLGGEAGQQFLNLGGTTAQLLLLRYSRDDEREADALGVEYAGMAGYKPSEAAAFFGSLKRLSEQQAGGLPSFLSTHPDPGEREQTIIRISASWEAQGAERVDADAFLTEIDHIVVGDDPRQGFVADNVFYHPTMKFRFPVPAGYQVENQPTQVVMVEPNQKAIIVFGIAQDAATARDAGTAFAGQQGVTTVNSGAVQVGGNPAYYVLADAQTQDGTDVRLLSYFIEYGGQVFSFLGYAAKASFGQYQSAMERTMTGFDRETDPNILNVQPSRIGVTPASRNAAFRTFLPGSLPNHLTAEGMAILNQVGLDQQIARGHMLKLVQ